MAKKIKFSKLIRGMSSEEYHSTPGTVSSSQLKSLLEDPRIFFEKYVEKSVDREHIAAFDVGTYFHTGVLEPHLLKKEIVVFKGEKKIGAEWKKFASKHKGKTIVSLNQKKDAEKLIQSVKDSKVAMKYLKKGEPEVSLFVRFIVAGDDILRDGKIYAPDHMKVLTKNGWKDVQKIPKGVEIIGKVRADWKAKKYLLDLKSTSKDAESRADIAESIEYYSYQMSAAYYLDLFGLLEEELEDFIWTFASKTSHNCKSWVATPALIKEGRIMWRNAFRELAYNTQTKWKFPDKLESIGPAELKW